MNQHDRQAVAEAERQLAAAHLTLDLETIAGLLHRDYVIVQPGGAVETREDVLASYRAGGRHWETACSDELDIRLHGDTAVVVGRWLAAGQHDAEPFDYAARFLSIWIKENGRWQNIAFQSTELDGDEDES